MEYTANISFTPKMHSIFKHMKWYHGISDMLEGDVDHIYQNATEFSRKKEKPQKNSKWTFTKRNLEAISVLENVNS